MIVTAWIDESDLATFDRLRERFFPAERNHLHAHVTLFHHIGPDDRTDFIDRATDLLAGEQPFSAAVGTPFLLGGGVAYPLEPSGLKRLRAPLRESFSDSLTPQDARPWKRPHITVQNKVKAADAKRLHRHLAARFRPCELRILGLLFHRYDGGPWTELARAPLG